LNNMEIESASDDMGQTNVAIHPVSWTALGK